MAKVRITYFRRFISGSKGFSDQAEHDHSFLRDPRKSVIFITN